MFENSHNWASNAQDVPLLRMKAWRTLRVPFLAKNRRKHSLSNSNLDRTYSECRHRFKGPTTNSEGKMRRRKRTIRLVLTIPFITIGFSNSVKQLKLKSKQDGGIINGNPNQRQWKLTNRNSNGNETGKKRATFKWCWLFRCAASWILMAFTARTFAGLCVCGNFRRKCSLEFRESRPAREVIQHADAISRRKNRTDKQPEIAWKAGEPFGVWRTVWGSKFEPKCCEGIRLEREREKERERESGKTVRRPLISVWYIVWWISWWSNDDCTVMERRSLALAYNI